VETGTQSPPSQDQEELLRYILWSSNRTTKAVRSIAVQTVYSTLGLLIGLPILATGAALAYNAEGEQWMSVMGILLIVVAVLTLLSFAFVTIKVALSEFKESAVR
jgi:hypothetical protein